MAENLNYDYNEGTAKSFCYNDEPDSCTKYGRLYLWSAAMDSAGVFSDGGKGCGYGVECKATVPVRGVDLAGTKLKSKSGWYSGNGMDEFGFSVLPAASRDGVGYYNFADEGAFFWSSTEGSGHGAYNWRFYYGLEYVYSNNNGKDNGFSVRCLRDSD